MTQQFIQHVCSTFMKTMSHLGALCITRAILMNDMCGTTSTVRRVCTGRMVRTGGFHEVDEEDVLYSATHRVEDLADPVPTPPLAGYKLSRQ